jgi:hypothetical protein
MEIWVSYRMTAVPWNIGRSHHEPARKRMWLRLKGETGSIKGSGRPAHCWNTEPQQTIPMFQRISLSVGAPDKLGICTNHSRRMFILPLLIYQNSPTRKMGSGSSPAPVLDFQVRVLNSVHWYQPCWEFSYDIYHDVELALTWARDIMPLWHTVFCKCHINIFIYGFLTLWTMKNNIIMVYFVHVRMQQKWINLLLKSVDICVRACTALSQRNDSPSITDNSRVYVVWWRVS